MFERRAAVAGVLVALLLGASVAAAVGDGAVVTQPAERLDRQDRALLVSDSAWLGINTYGAADSVQGFAHQLDLASCRRRVSTSCVNYDGFVPMTLVEEVAWRHGTYDTLIVATGYNDSDHDFSDDVADIVALARDDGFVRVVWLTLRSNVTYTSPDSAGYAAVFRHNNETLRELVTSGTYPEVVIADWATYSQDRPEWFAPDGIHLRRAGPWAAGDYISRKMAFLDGRPCAQPLRPGTAGEGVCDDPDATGAIADLDALYPIGEPYPKEPFVLEFEGSSSWPAPPWWAR